MLCGDAMPRSSNAALEKGKGRFNGIGMNVPHDVGAGTVIDFLMVRSLSLSHGGFIGRSIVSKNHFHIFRDVLADILGQRSAFGIVSMEETQIAVALADADHYFLVVPLSDLSFVAIPAADVGHVHFDFAVKHRLIGLRHRMADSMAEIPRRFVGHTDRAFDLQRGHALLSFAEQVRSQKPLCKGQMGIVEDGARCDGELVVTVFAVEELLGGIELDHGAFAAQALRAFREAETHQKLAALILGAEQGVYIH